MQIVIDINDNEYMGIMEYPNNITSYPVTIHLYDAVRNGTPLPKEHGRLIDEEKISLSGIHFKTEHDHALMIGRLNTAPTIIEAEKRQQDED